MRSLLEWLFLYVCARNFSSQLLTFLFFVKERLFLSIIVPALKIGSFLFIGGTIVPINGSGLNEMEQVVPNDKFLFM